MGNKRRPTEFAAGNTDPNGGYLVGKNKPPVATRFKAGDGRKRGRRPKGTRNLASDLRDELEAKVEVSVGGVRKTVSRQRSVVMRLADNASRGQTNAIALILEYQQKVVEPLLGAELERAAKRGGVDLSQLNMTELQVLEYLMCKANGEPYTGTLLPVINLLAEGPRTGS